VLPFISLTSTSAQVLTYNNIRFLDSAIPTAQEIYAERGETFPNIPSLPDINAPTLNSYLPGARFNLRNNYNDADTSDVPLQFVYEAANCRLFHTAEDLIDMTYLWTRVANVTWGTGTCVDGSSINSDGSMPSGSYDTVAFSADAISNVTLPTTLGLVAQKYPVVATTTNSSSDPSDPATTEPAKKNNAARLAANTLALLSVVICVVSLL
jgi:hypothetical protein